MCYTDGEEGRSRMAGGPDMTRGRLRDENGRTTMLKELLEKRRLPELMTMKDGSSVTAENWPKRRGELLDVLAELEYGRFPEKLGETTWTETKQERIAAGVAKLHEMEITFPTPDGESFTFPLHVHIPDEASAEHPVPAFVFISFGYPRYFPLEELMNEGVIIAEFVMNDVAKDGEDNWSTLLSPHFFPDGTRPGDGTGKIGMWAYAASRAADYLLSLDCVDPARLGVVGHSRLGKTALWAGANDERFTHVFSNDSGCSGAAITRKKIGETFPRICQVFPYWFCENMKTISASIEASEETPFDQHFLLAAVCPRKVYVASAGEDDWADPTSEYLGCLAASPAWEAQGLTGFAAPDRLPEAWDTFQEGRVGFHLRPGTHFLSRHDWIRYIRYIKA